VVKIARCIDCGRYYSEVWSEKPSCPECGGETERIDVDMGSLEMIHRVFNVGGIALMIAAAALAFYNIFISGSRTTGWIAFGIFMVSVGFFVISLFLQVRLTREAIETDSSRKEKRRPKRLRETTGQGMRRTPEPRRGRKIPVRDDGRSPLRGRRRT
jgi:hypothetical protein